LSSTMMMSVSGMAQIMGNRKNALSVR